MLQTAFPALETREARIFYATQLFSLIGTFMQNTVLPLLAYRLTGQPLYLGLVGFASTLPVLLLTLPAGVIVERLNKRNLVIALQSVMMTHAFLMAAFTLYGTLSIWHIIILSLLLGLASAVEVVARQTWMVDLVGPAALSNGIALQSTIFNVARVLGPILSVPLLLMLGTQQGALWVFIFNALSFLLVIIALFTMKTRFNTDELIMPSQLSWREQFAEGRAFIANNLLVFMLLLMVAIVGLFGTPAIQQIPAFAQDVLRQEGDNESAVIIRNSLLFLAQGFGTVLAGVTASIMSSVRQKGGLLIIGQVVLSAALLGWAASNSIGYALPIMMLIGWGTVMTLTLTNQMLQMKTPIALRGRVISAYLWASQGLSPFGSLLIGWFAESRGVPFAITLAGCMCLVTLVGLHLFTPAVRQARE